VDALHLTHSPENGKVWVTAERVDLRASYVSGHVRGEWLTSPGVSDRIEPNNGSGAILVYRTLLGQDVRVDIRNITDAVHMGSLSRDGT
jgi:hypothetical protein